MNRQAAHESFDLCIDSAPNSLITLHKLQGLTTVARPKSGHLKLHVADSQDEQSINTSTPVNFDVKQLHRSFAEATGWRICPSKNTAVVAGSKPHGRTASGAAIPLEKRFQLVPDAPIDGMLDISEGLTVCSEQSAWALLAQIDSLVQSLSVAESTVVRQEAQLAASVGINIRADESEVLASKLQETLQRAVEQTASDAAAIYLLDEQTSELKMRSCFGMPSAALCKPARMLRECTADLEALLGNAVLLENTSLAREWNCPENFAAALCLPIGSPTMPHGTIWLWSNHVRDFCSEHIEAAKAASDKILVDIERSVLADEVLKSRAVSRGVESASLIQATRLPNQQRLHSDYDMAGWTFQGQSLGGNFHQWNCNRFGQIIAALGDATLPGTSGAIVATTLQTIVETCWNSKHDPKQLFRKANDMLWANEDGDWRAALGYLQLDPTTGEGNYCLAGDIQAFLIGCHGYRRLNGSTTLLGEQPDSIFSSQQLRLEGGEMIVMASGSLVSGLLHGGLSQTQLLHVLRDMYEEPVDQIADHLARQLPLGSVGDASVDDRSLLILRRRF